MEEEKAAAYYDELTRKGEGAARFKQGLGFSSQSSTSTAPSKTRSFLSNFVRASSPTKASQLEKQAQLESIQNKLKKKPKSCEENSSKFSDRSERDSRVSDRNDKVSRDRDRHSSRRSRSRERRSRSRDRRSRSRDRRSRYRSSSRDRKRRSRDGDRDSDGDRERRRRGGSDEVGGRRRDRGRSRSSSPRERRLVKVGKEKNGGVDYARLIDGYDKMTPAERVKAKMKLQLSETAEKDATKGMGSGWERFEFNKDAPLDDEEIEAAEDDAMLVKHVGQSFRFSAVETRREEQIKAAHDEAIFGGSTIPPSNFSDNEPEVENDTKESNESSLGTSLISEKVLAKQQGSWRDRARRV